VTRTSAGLVVVGCLVGSPLAYADPPIIEKIEVHGNRRLDPDAVLVHVGSKVGQRVDWMQVRSDLRELWKIGAFANLEAVTDKTPAGGAVLVFEVVEQPAVRKVFVDGNHDLELDKINDVLDLKRDEIVDLAAVRKNRDKIQELYIDHGYMLATVDMDVVPAGTGLVDVKYTVNEAAKIQIADINFIGNNAISTDELRDTISTKRPNALAFMNDSGLYRTDAFARDLAILTAKYLDHGFATIKIGAPALRLSRDKKRMYATITIDEGPRFTFGTIGFRGDVLATTDHAKLIKSRSGETFSRTLVERDREAVETYYQDQGYAHANVMPRMKIDQVNRRIEIAYEVARGKKTYIERIHVRGNSKTSDKVIRRELKIAEGDLYGASKLEESRRRVMALGYFENVMVSTARGSSDEFVDVNLEIKERSTGTFQIGAGFSSIESFIVQAQISQENFLNRGWSLAFQAQISSIRRLLSFRFVDPYFLDTNWTLATELYNQSRGFGTFSRNATGGALTWGYPIADHLHGFVTYRLEDVGITGGSGGIANLGARSTELPSVDTANLFRGGWTSSVRGTLTYDTRNNRLFPTGGVYANLYGEYAGRLTGSENEFVRWGGFVRKYQHLGGPFTLRLNAEVGVTTSLDGKGVPLTERYLLGGIYDIRGYQPRSIGPQLFAQHPGDIGAPLDPLPLGGNLQLIGNAEIEFPLVKSLGLSGVAFFDIGNAYNLENRFCSRNAGSSFATDACLDAGGMFTNLRKSVGLGVRWMSPIGPLRFEWGIPLDLKPGETPSGLDFTIGTSF
jgi:outer membrane protein insertion porin family